MNKSPLVVKVSAEEMAALNRDGVVPIPRRIPISPIIKEVCAKKMWKFAKAVGLPRTFKTRCLLSGSYNAIRRGWQV